MPQQGSFTVGTSEFDTLLRIKHLLVGIISAQTICIYLFIFGMAGIYDIRLFNFTIVNDNDFYFLILSFSLHFQRLKFFKS